MQDDTRTDETQDVKINENFFNELNGEPPIEKPEEKVEEKVEEIPVEEKAEEKVVEGTEEKVDESPEEKLEEKPFNIKDLFPEYDDIESVKSALERAKGVPSNEEILTLKEKAELFEKYEKKFSSLKDSGLSPELVRLQLAEKENPDKAKLYKRLLYGDPTDLEMIKLDFISQFPELAEDSEMLDYQLEKKYPLLYGPDADSESEEYGKELKSMKFDAMQVKKKIKGEFDSMEVPEYPSSEKSEEKLKETIKTWQPHFEGHKEEIMGFPVEVDGEKVVDFKIPDDQVKKYTGLVANFIASQGLDYSKVALQKVKDYVKGVYIGENLTAYNKAIFDMAVKKTTEKNQKSIHNPKQADTKAKQTIESEGDAFWNNLPE